MVIYHGTFQRTRRRAVLSAGGCVSAESDLYDFEITIYWPSFVAKSSSLLIRLSHQNSLWLKTIRMLQRSINRRINIEYTPLPCMLNRRLRLIGYCKLVQSSTLTPLKDHNKRWDRTKDPYSYQRRRLPLSSSRRRGISNPKSKPIPEKLKGLYRSSRIHW